MTLMAVIKFLSEECVAALSRSPATLPLLLLIPLLPLSFYSSSSSPSSPSVSSFFSPLFIIFYLIDKFLFLLTFSA